MYLFYIDESGNTGRHPHPDEPVHWLIAVAVHARAVRAVEAEMHALALQVFGGRACDPGFEFHGADLFSGRRECRLLPPATRVKAYHSLAGLLARHGCMVFVRGIDKTRAAARAAGGALPPPHPHALGFQLLVECIDRWLACCQPEFAGPAPDPVVGLLVADEQKEVEREIVHAFARRKLGEGRRPGAGFLVDTVHRLPSVDSWLLQLADCIAYLRNRYEKVVRGKILPGLTLTAADQEIVALWERLCLPAVESDEVWP